ncbi:MAG: lamin tail domain-containing protein [Balneolaceae bacterium]|nr:lamin tail domain-containing protein [Balneolaceae bacterium]
MIESNITPEPSNHVTNFSASSSSISEIDLSWTDASGSTPPENYLILINESGSFTAPSDGTEQSDDTDLSDGSGVLNIAQGVESATISGLDSNTQYYFEIYPYTNLGSNIDYKTDGTIPSANVSTLEKPDLVLNEILSDPDGDANGDGTVDTFDDEFLEFVNIGSSDIDISNWVLSDETADRHTFPAGTILKPNQAIVIFDGGTPTGDFGGSIIQTAGNLSLNNGGEKITVTDGAGNLLIEEIYAGATQESETRSPDLTGTFEDHTTADTEDASEFSPGTRIDGFAFHPRVEITGNEGWRMLSTPTSDNKYHDLLNNIWTQCSGGADYNGSSCSSTDEPNVQFYNVSTDQFEGVSDLDGTGTIGEMTPGQGFIVYVYSDDDFDGSADGFPKTLEMFGTENNGIIDPPLNAGSDAATLVGNPFLVPIDWDDLTKTDLTGTAYVYDHSYGTISGSPDEEASGVSGSYRAWSSSPQTGSLSDGLIAPLQAFWVINSSSTPSPDLKMSRNASVKGGSFYKKNKNDIPKIQLRAENKYMFNEAYISFNIDGLIGKDSADGYELTPLDHGNYISLSTEVEGTQMDINNLPVELYNPVEIPLHVQAFEAVESGWSLMGGEVTLSWPEMNNIPSDWEITLTDTKLNRTVDLKNTNNYVFEAEGSRAKIANKEPFSPFNPKPFQKEKAVSDARFLITINPNVPDGLIDDNIPDQFTLEQNYPNPFNPTTNIKFEIAETSDVTLNIYNVMGQRVATLVNEVKAPGTYEIAWDAQEMASGIYYYRLRAGGVVFNRQMTLIK